MLKTLGAVVLALVCGFFAFHFAIEKSFVNPYPVVCDLVAKKIFLDTRDLKEWKRTCNHRSRLVTPYSKKELILKDINNVLALLKVSHLEIYDASEVKSIWQGENKETGINGEFIDSELVIFKVHPRSPAENLGFKKGDVIVSINGEQPSSWSVENEGGDYQIHRGPEEFTIKMIPGTVHRDDSMHVTTIGKNARLLEIPSFRADFFKGSALKTVAADLKGASTVVVDLRGNAGGNFVAGLRLLSMFICEPTEIGKLVKPKSTAKTKSLMPNDLDDVRQLAVLEANHEVVLKTFKQEGCFAGAVKVLVDGKSSSVAEMVAQGLKEFRKSPVRGTPSRGQLLVGVWYPIDEIAQGVQISIPEALYVSAKGRRIEGQGVELEKTLYYNLPEMQAGIDSWVKSFLD